MERELERAETSKDGTGREPGVGAPVEAVTGENAACDREIGSSQWVYQSAGSASSPKSSDRTRSSSDSVNRVHLWTHMRR